MTDLDALRPEVREALVTVFAELPYGKAQDEWRVIRTELLRLAKIEKDYGFAIDCERRRADEAEAEIAEARETIKRLNRRVQVAEAGVVEKVKEHAGGSLGRALANAAADRYMRERDEARSELAALKAGIAESAHVDVTLGCAIDGEIPPDLALCKVALVKMEE